MQICTFKGIFSSLNSRFTRFPRQNSILGWKSVLLLAIRCVLLQITGLIVYKTASTSRSLKRSLVFRAHTSFLGCIGISPKVSKHWPKMQRGYPRWMSTFSSYIGTLPISSVDKRNVERDLYFTSLYQGLRQMNNIFSNFLTAKQICVLVWLFLFVHG